MSRGTQASSIVSQMTFAYRAVTSYDGPFQASSANHSVCNSLIHLQVYVRSCLLPSTRNSCSLTRAEFGLFPVRSPLLGESRLLSLPRGTEMFQFPRLAPYAYVFSIRCQGFPLTGFPIRTSPDLRSLAPTRGFSQLTTSFFAS